MSWPFKDYDYIGDRYITIRDSIAPWDERKDINIHNTPTECIICIEAENEMYTKYAHPKAHLEANTQASIDAEKLASKKKETKEYIDYYIFHYGREYKKLYKDLYKKYKQEYSSIVLERTYEKTDKICDYHHESIHYHFELKNFKEEINLSPKYDVNVKSSSKYDSEFKSFEEDLNITPQFKL